MTRPAGGETQARPVRGPGAALVAAARRGDREALDSLVRGHLPMVYNLVRQALGGHPDVDDVVQDVVLRALRQLPHLREPESFRPWLASIALRQIGTHQARADVAARRTAPLDAATWMPDPDAAGPALLRVELAGQRRQVRNASRWLSAKERAILSLWWLETAGELTRAEVAAALGLSVAHAGVRLQRMRDQLDLSRTIVAALEAMPGCERLGAVVADWNGVPSPFWRKRIARHTRSCPVCATAADRMIPAERLLAGIALLPVPETVDIVPVPPAGRFFAGWRPWAAVAGGALAVGLAVGISEMSETAPPPAPAVAAPASAPPPPPLRAGRVSLESANEGGRYVSVAAGLGVLDATGTDRAARRLATFDAVAGLSDRACFTFRTADGKHLRHQQWRLRTSTDQGTSLARGDATFCTRDGETTGSVSLESANYPGWFLRHVGDELWVDQNDGSAAFRADSSFFVRSPLG